MRTTTRTCALWLCLLLCGCATLPPGTTRSPRDPWERMNRATYKFNDKLDKAVLRPVARTYQRARAALHADRHPQLHEQPQLSGDHAE